VYDAAVFTSQALSAITSGSVTTTIFLSLSYILSVASRRKHGSPEEKKLVRLARALLNLASITWAFISLLRHIPGFCAVGQKNGLVAVDGFSGSLLDERIMAGYTFSDADLVKKARRRREFTTLRNVTFLSCYDGDTCFFTLPEVVEHVPELAPLFGGEYF
jgi:hypothetical protein